MNWGSDLICPLCETFCRLLERSVAFRCNDGACACLQAGRPVHYLGRRRAVHGRERWAGMALAKGGWRCCGRGGMDWRLRPGIYARGWAVGVCSLMLDLLVEEYLVAVVFPSSKGVTTAVTRAGVGRVRVLKGVPGIHCSDERAGRGWNVVRCLTARRACVGWPRLHLSLIHI